MSETTPETLDLDAWLDGAHRAERSVTLYARADLLADLDQLEAKLRQVAEIPAEDRSYADADEGAEIRARIDDLNIQLDASKLVVRVTSLEDTEYSEIVDQVKKDLKSEADKAASDARAEAREKCRRLEITAANDINAFIRPAANAAADAVIEREVSIRTIAAAVVSPKMSVDQVRKLYSRIGDAQVGLLSQAYTRASIEAPQVTVPKSSKPSQAGTGTTSS
ncbi:tail assembly chaperone [Arthrobacter phage TripleJ]|uniref:Tail assembly chaperone n=1 Tax=Arthrobacter phage TripleJ TaxID=2599838 RepID=A0A5J6TIK5_9CAUD|nr:tail assembly chaperone [Arthrobacter phage TripleJ]QFG09559.1 tail assembly chaperone [Arthrobacter phage TripleJ]